MCQKYAEHLQGKAAYVGMVDWVHCHTTSLGPAVPLDLVLVVSGTGLEHGFVDTSTTSDDTDGCAGSRSDNLLCAGWELDAGLASVGVVSDNGSVVAGSSCKRSSVSGLLLNVADDGTLWETTDGEDVSDR